MDEVSIALICKTNFTEEEIRAAKSLLFTSLKVPEPSRRRDEKGEKSLQDIIKVLKITDPDDVPTFVAKDLRRLPPVDFDHLDCAKILRDVASLRSRLAEMELKFEASQTTIGELRAEVDALRNTTSVCRSPETANVNTRRGVQRAFDSFESANSSAADSAPPRPALPASPVPISAPRSVETIQAPTSTPRGYAAAVASNPPDKRQTKTRMTKRPDNTSHREPLRSAVPVPLNPPKDQVDEKGFVKVEKKKRKPIRRNQCGTAPTGPNHLLRPATPSTLLYVSRLHFTTQPCDLVKYIQLKTHFALRVDKLHSRNNTSFNSFVVRVPTSNIALFTSEEFWPKGVVFRRFRGRLPDTPAPPHPHSTSQTNVPTLSS